MSPGAVVNSEPESSRLFNLGGDYDCPVFEGMYDFCRFYTGGSIDGAIQLNQADADIAINWAGGLHHARRNEAAGFWYLSRLVFALLSLNQSDFIYIYLVM